LAATTTPGGYLLLCSVLTFHDAGLWQRSLRGRHLGFCLRGGSGLLGCWREFLFCHRCGGFIPIPGQVRRFSAEYTIGSQPSTTINQMCYLGKIFTYRLDRTTVTVGAPRMLAVSTSPASAGASSCTSVAACSSAAAVVASVLPSTTGAGASAAPRAPPRWGLGCGYLQPALPPYPSRLRPPAPRGQKAKSPASNGVSLSAHYIETQVLDYPTQGSLPLEMWSP
jgi:hypothetical protein